MIAEKLNSKYEPVPESGCWLWTDHLDKDGYGLVRDGKKMKRPHRVSYEIKHGPIQNGLYVLHRCDVRCCVNPDHLFLGTQEDNVRDMIAKGRDLNMQKDRNKTHCLRGHEFNEENTRLVGGKRKCRECDRMTARSHYWKSKNG